MIRRSILGGVLALAGCKPKAADPPPDPEPVAVAAVPEQWSEPPPPPIATTGSWAPLLRVVPDAAMVAGVDVSKLKQSPFWSSVVDQAGPKIDQRGAVEAAGICGIRLADFRRAVIAKEADTADGASLLVVEAPGLGETSRIDCIVDKARITDAAWQGSKLVLEGGATHVIPLSGDVVVAADASWVPAVEAAIVSGRAEAHPGVVVLTDRADLNAGLWFVGKMPAGGSVPDIREFAFTGDTTNGLRMAVWLGITPGQIDTVQTAIQAQVDMLKSAAPLGLSQAVMQSFTMTQVGDGLLLQASISETELQTLFDTVKGLL